MKGHERRLGDSAASPVACPNRPATDVWGASVTLAQDFLGYVLATPQGLADFFVYCTGLVRALPTFGRQLFDGQQCAIDSATA